MAMTAALSLSSHASAATFGDDATFLAKHTEIVQLTGPDGKSKVALAPAWQGRVMTSTADGDGGLSYGWINRELISSGKTQPHINVFGGEDRFWLGPEGGQFSIFFAKGASFDLDHWFTPGAIDTLPYRLVRKSPQGARFAAAFGLTNFSGTRFDVAVDREIRLLGTADAWQRLGGKAVLEVKVVAYESRNKISNTGKAAWTKDSGLLSEIGRAHV